MMKTGMFIVTNPNKFTKFIPRILKEIKSTLYIQFYPKKKFDFKSDPPFNGVGYNSPILNIYQNSLDLRKLDVRVLLSGIRNPSVVKITTKRTIEIVYFDQLLNSDEMQKFVRNYVENRSINCKTIVLDDEQESSETSCCTNENDNISESFDSVVLGGTFDRLHHGHKILLSEAILHCNKRLTVGVTDLEMLKSKKLWELIEPCSERITQVKDFLEDVEPDLEYDVVPITDIYGPTKDDPTFQLLIVSAETYRGGEKVNELRIKNGLNPLLVRNVGIIPDDKDDEEEEDKVSSSNNRMRLLGLLLREPESRSNLPQFPFIIGFTGGIASGKTSVCERFKNYGVPVINCDKLGHQLYEKGSLFYFKIIQIFGKKILNEDKTINRKKLGDIVFNNKDELEKLNKLLWPAILDKCRTISNELYEEGHQVIILEAAVLIQAGWTQYCHEVWTCIIPPEEAISRLQSRNVLSEKEAVSRMSLQPSNKELISHSHVVFCTLWRPEYTQKQVDRCWIELQERLIIQKDSNIIKN